jgi:aspartyl-tRNA(Asn)/glutamyl-tRNA(Gln) amidotransferase subunit B
VRVTGPPGSPMIGLEVHVQLRTRTKLFCGCSVIYGAVPNTSVCEICLGLPGALPVLNAGAVELAVRAALALGFQVREVSAFARKHYFYPDLPKGYQITQHESPLASAGVVQTPGVSGPQTVALRRLHIEEDSARSLHDAVEGATALDFNRAGVPLVEIVTEPDIDSPAAAREVLTALKRTLEFAGVSDCNMEEGSLRVDANISLRGAAGEPGGRAELKNLNSFSAVKRALEHEVVRQHADLEAGRLQRGETRFWDARAAVTRPLRGKEEFEDYRYISEPDLPPLLMTAATLGRARAALPEPSAARAARIAATTRLPADHIRQLTSTRSLADRFEAVVRQGIPPELAASWMLGEERAADPGDALPVPALSGLLLELEHGRITRAQARELARELPRSGAAAADLIEETGTARVGDAGILETWAREVIETHPVEVERYREGDDRLINFFIGQVMRRSRGSADPARLGEALWRLLREG